MIARSARKASPCQKGLPASIFITVIFFGLNSFPIVSFGIMHNLRSALLVGVALLFSSVMMFLILYTGKLGFYRRIFFVTLAVSFAVHFVWFAIEDRGHMWSLDQEALYAEIPMCHIAVPELLVPLLVKREIIFPGHYVAMVDKILMVLLIAVIYGRAFCAWGCLFGGQDEMFSSLPKKSRWAIKKLPPFLLYLPFAVLLFIILHSLATMTPTYCVWLCPYKTVGDYMELNSGFRIFQTVLFVSFWLVLVVLLPFLTRKRTQCAWFCPAGAFLTLTSKINLFEVRIQPEKCRGCQQCVRVCPTYSMTPASREKGKPSPTCTRCGLCIDACPEGAISLAMKGVPFTASDHPLLAGKEKPGFWRQFAADLIDPGVLFTFGIFWMATNIASPFIVDALSRLLRFFFGW